jgi:hypothetical protein
MEMRIKLLNRKENTYLQEFFRTMFERQGIFERRLQGISPPWTEDVILDNYFFCNVFRRFDKCSRWIVDNIVPLDNWKLLIIFRFISTYTIFEYVKKNCNITKIDEILNCLKKYWKENTGKSKLNGCFIRNPRWILDGKIIYPPIYSIPFLLCDAIEKDGNLLKVLQKKSLQKTCQYLKKFPGVGGFMAYEYACDFAYSNWFHPMDSLTWANKGPGAERGMSLIIYGHNQHKFSQEEWCSLAQLLLQRNESKQFEQAFGFILTMREIEHWLCEFQKYVKYKNNFFLNKRCKVRKYVR